MAATHLIGHALKNLVKAAPCLQISAIIGAKVIAHARLHGVPDGRGGSRA
jgi:hypothetical protein